MLFTPIIFDRGLSAELKTSAIDNKYDIPFVMPSQLGNDLKHSIQLNNSNQHDNAETLDNEMMLGNASQTNNGMNFALVCSKMPIASVVANANDGNLPTNTIDNNLNTRWSNLGSGSWIQFDLGSMESICSVDVNWYRGDIRQNNFVISVSNDGTTFTDKFTGTSNLGTVAEKYSLPAGTEGRYVRITVNGNTENQWASVTEVAVYGLEQASLGPIILKKQTAPGSNTWIPYKSLGGNIQSDPSVIRNSDNTLQVFAVSATNGELLYKKQTAPGSNTWTPYKSLGGNIQSDPSVIRNTDNTLQVFAVSATNGELLYKKQTAPGSNTWIPYKSLGGNIQSDPFVTLNNAARLEVFVIGPEGATGNPPGSSTTKDGVTVPFKIKGEWDYEYETNERDGGARYNMNAAGTSLVMVGYFTMSGGDDDVAAKLLGGRHTDSAPYEGCVYDPAIQTDNGQPRLRAECPHPDYTGNLDLDFSKQGISYHGKWVGTMAVAIQEQNGVRIQMFQDQGDNEVRPANQWVKVLEFFDDGTKVSGIEGADRFPIRELPNNAQNTWRIDESPGLQEKWLAIAEIDVSQ